LKHRIKGFRIINRITCPCYISEIIFLALIYLEINSESSLFYSINRILDNSCVPVAGLIKSTDKAFLVIRILFFIKLFEKGLISAATSVVSDDDLLSILCGFTGEDENAVAANPRRKYPRFAVVVSKKIYKSAVRRNRIRRRIYECIRRELPNSSNAGDLAVIVTSAEVLTMPAAELDSLVVQLLRQACPQ